MSDKTTLLTCMDLADRLQISRGLANALMQRGKIPSVRLGRAVRVRPQDLEGYIEANLFATGWISAEGKSFVSGKA